MTSCEPHQSSAYSEDMRWRMVWQSQALGLSLEAVAQDLIDIWTVKRIVSATTEDVCKKLYPSERAFRKYNEPV